MVTVWEGEGDELQEAQETEEGPRNQFICVPASASLLCGVGGVVLMAWCWWCGVGGVVLVVWCWWCGVGGVVLVVWCDVGGVVLVVWCEVV